MYINVYINIHINEMIYYNSHLDILLFMSHTNKSDIQSIHYTILYMLIHTAIPE